MDDYKEFLNTSIKTLEKNEQTIHIKTNKDVTKQSNSNSVHCSNITSSEVISTKTKKGISENINIPQNSHIEEIVIEMNNKNNKIKKYPTESIYQYFQKN